jgi:hypothetical protein
MPRWHKAPAAVLVGGWQRGLFCDAGTNSEAVIQLNTTTIFRNGPVRIGSFVLVMPSGREL